MRNEHYVKAVAAVKTLNTKSGTLFRSMVAFVVGAAYNSDTVPAVGTNIKPLFKVEERQALVEDKVEMDKNSTYRVVKNLLANCVAVGIDIREKGKTELEAELAGTKTPKGELEKFKLAMVTAGNIGKKLNASERITAAKLAQELMTGLANSIELAA